MGGSDSAQWEATDNWPFKWPPLLVDKLRQLGLPRLETPDLWVASDYSGAQRGSRFMMIGVLIGDAGHSAEWELRRRKIRKQHLPDSRRMSFKGLNDSKRRAALIPFLN